MARKKKTKGWIVKVGKRIVARTRKKPRVVKASKHQTGKRKSIKLDRKRKAMKPGKRISKSGKVYYEYRRNRSDLKGWI
ncbi:MAG: hypothetical protein ACTSWZ_05230 [Candidatus Heimdallarchaeaceae archaeon]